MSTAKIIGNIEFVEPQTVRIDAGWFIMGSDEADLRRASPAHTTATAAFFIDRCEVVNRDWLAFVRATHARP